MTDNIEQPLRTTKTMVEKNTLKEFRVGVVKDAQDIGCSACGISGDK